MSGKLSISVVLQRVLTIPCVPMDSSALTGGLVLIGAGLLVAVAWFFATRTHRSFKKRQVRSEGTVIAVSKYSGFDRMPTVEYKDEAGIGHVLHAKISYGNVEKGDRLVVYYDARAPERAVLATHADFSRLFAVGAVVLIVVGIGCVSAYGLVMR